MNRIERIERRLKLNDVRVFLSVVQAGSMHGAAERLGTSQPAVSRSVSELEHALGVRLLDRSRRGVEPTRYGRAFVKRGMAVFDELRQGIKDIEFLGDSTTGELRIGCTEAAAAGPGLAVMDRLNRRYPRITFRVVTGGATTLYRYLAEREVELVLAGIAGAVPEEFGVEKLFDDSLVVAAGLQNPWTRRRKIELAELANEPWTLPPGDSDPGALILEAFRAKGIPPPRICVATTSRNLRDALLATGRYLSIFAGYALTSPSKHPLIKALPVELPDVSRPIVMLTLRNRTPSPLAELFMKTARSIPKPATKIR
jgi:DNA-binding transcriptional LysR family regulator